MSKNNTDSKKLPFIITISYLSALVGIRLAVLIAGSAHTSFAQAAKIGELPDKSFSIGRNIILFGHHIHHFYIGILLISIAGWFAIVESKQLSKKLIAVMYGIGLGLFLDEIGLLLTWGDYFSGVTYMLSILTFGIFINIVFFSRFWSSLKEELLSAHSHNSFEEFILKNKNLMNVIDLLSEKTSHTTQVRRIFYTLIYFILAGLVLLYPKFIRYWVGGIFITHGLLLLPQIIIEQNGE